MIQVDPDGEKFVRYCLKLRAGDTPEIRQAFNEGVVCAAHVLGAFADGPNALPPQAVSVIEKAYRTMLGIRVKSIPVIESRE